MSEECNKDHTRPGGWFDFLILILSELKITTILKYINV